MSYGQTIYMAELETTSWTFQTFAGTAETARVLMRRAWKRHRKATGATYRWEDVEDGCNVRPVKVGKAYRDGSEV